MSGSHRYDVLVAGEINVDLILTGGEVRPHFGHERLVEDATLAMGSSSVIFACQAALLGLRVAFVGMAGRDTFGDFMLAGMNERGIDTGAVVRLPGSKTGITVSLSEPRDRAMLTFAGTIAALRADDVRGDLLASARHLHVSSAFLQTGLLPDLAGLFARAKGLGCSTSLDTGCDPAERWDGAVGAALRHVDVFMPNEVEAPALTGATSPEAALEVLAGSVPVVAVKLGGRGAVAAAGTARAACPPYVVDVVDTTGAGDSFDAGFIYGYLAGWPLERCLRLGCACGALSTRAAGGTGSQSTLAKALALAEA
ncbi:MAG: carbohydrate kinase family protein [Anaerolineae bacterium]